MNKLCDKIVNWVGDCIYKVVKWFVGTLRETIEKKTKDFLKQNMEKIMNAENKEKVGKLIAQQKALKELKNEPAKLHKSLSDNDQKLVEEMFEEEEKDKDKDYIEPGNKHYMLSMKNHLKNLYDISKTYECKLNGNDEKMIDKLFLDENI